VPPETEWYVLVDPAYPWGVITFYPARERGITQTFPHQNYNGAGPVGAPWRQGDPCLDTSVRTLGRHGYDSEPYGLHERLRWRFQRALDWLVAAAQGALAPTGDPFELPQFPGPSALRLGIAPAENRGTIAFTEGEESFAAWQAIRTQRGLLDLTKIGPGQFVVRRFCGVGDRDIMTPPWGGFIEQGATTRSVGAWLRLTAPVALLPWQAPATWGELRRAVREQGATLDDPLRAVLPHLRGGERRVLLLGFPIPETIGGASRQMHWQALLLPPLMRSAQRIDGFRPNEGGRWIQDRVGVLADNQPLEWLPSENWNDRELTTRGRLPAPLTQQEILVIGTGALGSAVAELLVRAGVRRLVAIDGDALEAGNLVRHTLGLDAVGQPKAEAVAERLNRASPHASVVAIPGRFPPASEADQALVRRCRVVLDCTGDDAVLHHLERFGWPGETLFASLSLSLGVRRLYCFEASAEAFPLGTFRALIAPWLAEDIDAQGERPLPRAGIGCWHPVFPARADDVWLLAAVAVKHLAGLMENSQPQPRLAVFEQQDDGGFSGVRRIGIAQE